MGEQLQAGRCGFVVELPEPEPGTAQICRAEGQDPTSKLKVLPLQLSFCLATSPWDGQQ